MHARNPFHSSFLSAPVLLTICLASGCGGGGHSEFVVPNPGVVVVSESEPNDSAFNANFFGAIAPGDHFLIEGEIESFFPDFFDGFAFVSTQPSRVEFFLHHGSFDDFDVCVYDPFFEDFVACYETDLIPESGYIDVLDANLEFHLVVTPFSGSGDYQLEVLVTPLPLIATSASESAASRLRPGAFSAAQGERPKRSSEAYQKLELESSLPEADALSVEAPKESSEG